MIAKEEGDSSQVNQPYDGEVAVQDKSMGRDLLGLLRSTTGITRGIVDQWCLVHVVVEVLSAGGSAWKRSAIRVNMHPNHRLSFEDWIQSLTKRGVLQSGDNFKFEGAVDKYYLLPAFWRGMEPSERQSVVSTVESHGGWGLACLQQLHANHGVPHTDMQKLRVCVEVAGENPESLGYPSGMAAPVRRLGLLPEHAVLAANASATNGLLNFTRCPPGYKGQKLLDWMTLFAKRRLKKGEKLRPSARCGDVEMSADQALLFNPSLEDLTIREIMKDAGGDGAVKKMAQRKLDSAAFVNAYCCYANSETRIKRFEQAARLAASIAEIQKLTIEAEHTKKKLESDMMGDAAPVALARLRSKEMNFNSITVKELVSIAYIYYPHKYAEMPTSGNKQLKVDKLSALYQANKQNLDSVQFALGE
jgi:hypothetical protein